MRSFCCYPPLSYGPAAIGLAFALAVVSVPASGTVLNESKRDIPMALEKDVIVVGGGPGAVAAGLAAARQGADVFLAAPFPYLGDEMTATLQLWLEEGESLQHPLARRLYSDRREVIVMGAAHEDRIPAPRPMHVKKTLDTALIEAGITFVYSTMVTDILRDGAGRPAGIVMANRAGRQAVAAPVIIDASSHALVARLVGAAFREYPAGLHSFKRVVIGGGVKSGPGISARIIEPSFFEGAAAFPIIEYTLAIEMADGGLESWMRADQLARTLTYDPAQEWTSDLLFQVPPDPLHAIQPVSEGVWAGAGALPLDALRAAGIPEIYVLGGHADIPRDQAEKLMRPVALMEMGERVGAAAAALARDKGRPDGVHLPSTNADGATIVAGDVGEILKGMRPVDASRLPKVPQAERILPVIGRYDVLVIGGGTSGAPAGIAAARQGARTLVTEYLHGLGGVGTEGAITRYWHGNRVGFTAEVMDGARAWRVEERKEWWRRALLDAGGTIWFGVLGAGAIVEDGVVRGAVVATPYGRGAVLADVVIDATGNSDVAAAAGAETDYTDATTAAMQGTGLPGRVLGGSYSNTDFTITDETDLLDMWQVFVHAKHKFPDAFDQARLIDTRERRRIIGDLRIGLLDVMMRRTYPDTVVRAYTNYDTHGYTVHPFFVGGHIPQRQDFFYADIPYRAMLPRDVEGLLVVGLGISAHRDAVPLIRMQPDIQNGGYAAGVAASMAVRDGVFPRHIDVRTLQSHLVEIGSLPPGIMEQEDSYPKPHELIAEAVYVISQENAFEELAIVLAHPDIALPLLRKEYAASAETARRTYAKVLAVLGDDTGLDTLLEILNSAEDWDEGWNFRGMHQFGRSQSALDDLITAIGMTRQPRALPAVLVKLDRLTPDTAFSHHRAVARALEWIGHPDAAAPLAALLQQEGMSGHDHPDIHTAIARESPGGRNAAVTRALSYREIILARALVLCGDHDGVGRSILERYTKDLRGHFARHARAILDE